MSTAPEPIIDEGFEDRVLACLLRLREFAAAASPHLRASYFSSAMRHNIAKAALDFHSKYSTVITGKALTEELKYVIKAEELEAYANEIVRLGKINVTDFKWVLDNLIIFIKNKETRLFIEAAVSRYLPKNDFAAIEKEMAKLSSISAVVEKKPYFHHSDKAIDERNEKREAEAVMTTTALGIPTGIPVMDRTMPKGGWYKKELYIVLAPPKRGKTMSLLWFANFATWKGFNVLFVTMETATEILSDRVDGMNTMIETKALLNKRTHVYHLLKSRKAKGQLIFLEYPTKTCTPTEIERQIDKLEVEEGIQIGMLIADYGDIMRPVRLYKDDGLREQASIFEDLRRIAGKYEIPVLTASQINRNGAGKAVNRGSDVAGTYDKIMVADDIITLSATDDEHKAAKLRICFSESRNHEAKTFLISTKYNLGTFYGDFIKEE